MKSNDSIPADEMLLAEALAAAKAKSMGWVGEVMWATADGLCLDYDNKVPDKAARCCAYGALVLADKAPLHHAMRPHELLFVAAGNDHGVWGNCDEDNGESLGWVFRCAMTQDESDPDTERLIRERSAP